MPRAFIPNPNLEKELEAEPQYTSGLAGATEPAKEAAKNFAPVLSGSYRDGIKIIVQGRKVYLSGTDWKSWLLEMGTSDTPIFACLRRGAKAGGLKFKDVGRR